MQVQRPGLRWVVVIERPPSLGVFAPVERRALRPPSSEGVEPNDNDPVDVAPATVGPPSATAGDPNGVEVLVEGQGAPWPRSVIRPSPWSGWPADWETPDWGSVWGRVEELVDIAWGCLDLNSSVLATMPPYLVNPAVSLSAGWLENPDPDKYTSWEEFAKQLFWDFQTGEAFVLCTAYYSTGWPARFHVVNPMLINAELVGGRRRYSIGGLDVTDDVLHIRYVSRTDDAHGHGPLEVARARLIAARMLTRYSTNLAASGAVPPAILTHPDELTNKQAEDLHTQWLIARTSKMGLPAVLSGGVTWQSVQISPKDMALVELSQFTESRIAVLSGVPPTLMGLPSGGDPLTYRNAEGIYDFHWRAYLKPRAQVAMSALSWWALPRGTHVELNRDAYVQPGPLERAQTSQILHGIVEVDGDGGERRARSVEEIRLAERFDTPATPAFTGVLT